jgi:hypothetical protein
MSIFSNFRNRPEWLKSDYTPVDVPRGGIALLDVFYKNGSNYDQVGRLDQVVENPNGLISSTDIAQGELIANVSSIVSKSTKIGVALRSLNLVTFGLASRIVFSGTQNPETSIDILYEGIQSDTVNLLAIDSWLRDCDLNEYHSWASELIVMERLYVAVGVVYASNVRVSLNATADSDATLVVTEGDHAPDGELSVQRTVKVGRTARLDSGDRLCIAVKLVKVHCDEHYGLHLDYANSRRSSLVRGPSSPKFELVGDSSVSVQLAVNPL